MKRPTFLLRSPAPIFCATLLFIGGSLTGCSSEQEDAASGQPTLATTARPEDQSTATSETVHVSAEFQAWVADTDELVKHVDDVFVGTVLSAGETILLSADSDIWTPYTVQVDQRLLGTVEGTITVAQHGGYDPAHDVIVIFGEDPLLEVGETYMLATLTDRECRTCRVNTEGIHFVAAVKGHVRVRNEAHRQELIQEYTEAIDQAGLGS